jgi:hypothetical protein
VVTVQRHATRIIRHSVTILLSANHNFFNRKHWKYILDYKPYTVPIWVTAALPDGDFPWETQLAY